jgi:hypothetical protein
MTPDEEISISVTASWKDWRSARVRLIDLQDVHWHQPIGAPHPLVHAYVACTDIAGGEFSHGCAATAMPHQLRVCVLKSHNIPAVYAVLVRQASHALPAAPCAVPRLGVSLPTPREC